MHHAQVVADAIDKVDFGRYSEAVELFNRFLSEHPEFIDDEFKTDILAVNKLIKYRKDLEEWDYFRSLKLVYSYFEKTYGSEDLDVPKEAQAVPDMPDVIWWCWLQVYDEAPNIVKACFRSLKKLNRPIIVLTEDNYSDYASLPEHIIRKWKDGIISNAHFADALRLELLTIHGGTWIDSTVLLTDASAYRLMTEGTELFAYAYIMHDATRDYILYGNWLIHSSAYSKILWETKLMLYKYWERENSLMNYFIFHLFFTISCRRNRDEMAKIPTYSDAPCHIMQIELLGAYSPERFRQLLSMSGIHKLTYRYDSSADTRGTILEHIINLNE